jgi:hypothetical protein
VRVVDEEFVRAAGFQRALDRRVDLGLEQVAVVLVVMLAGTALVPVDDSGRALHVGRDEDLHCVRTARSVASSPTGAG